MIISACVIGLNDRAVDFISNFKSRSYYKKTDEDSTARIHCIHVTNLDNPKYESIRHIAIDNETNNKVVSFLDEDQSGPRRVPFGDDIGWFAETDGHRTVIEFVDDEDTEKYLEALKTQFKAGYDIHITSSALQPLREELEQLASEAGAKIYFYEEESAVEELLNYLDRFYELELAKQGEPCGLDSSGVDWS